MTPPPPDEPLIPPYRQPPHLPRGTSSPGPNLSSEHLAEISAAKLRFKKIKRTITVAQTDAAITAFFGVVALMPCCGISWSAIFVGVVLAYVAITSFIAIHRLKQLDRSAPPRLALNQLILGSGVILYCAAQIWIISSDHKSLDDLATALSQLGMSVDLHQILLMAKLIYFAVILGTIFFQGFMARYYYSRQALIDEFRSSTPQWVFDLQKTGAITL